MSATYSGNRDNQMSIKSDGQNDIIVRLILIIGVLLLFTWNAQADTLEIKSEKEMKGRLEVGEKEMALLTVGDRVKLFLDKPGLVMPGDRMEIYEPTKTSIEDSKGDRLLVRVGKLVVTDVDDRKVMGRVEVASKEIFIGSYIDYLLPQSVQADKYSQFLKSLAKTFLTDPTHGTVTIAIPDVTDNGGSITRLSEEVYKEMSASVCQRPQFSCVNRADIISLMQGFDVQTSNSIGRYLHRKIAKKFNANLLLTAVVSPEWKKGELMQIRVVTYDLKTDKKMQDFELSADKKEYLSRSGGTDEVIVRNKDAKQGLFKIWLNRKALLNGRRVDNLFMIQLEDYVPKKQWKYIPEAVLNVEMVFDGKTLKPDDQGVIYYFDVINSGPHSLVLTVTPTIGGNSALPLGHPIEKSILLAVSPEITTETEVVLKVLGKQAIIVVDTNKMKEQVLLPIDFP